MNSMAKILRRSPALNSKCLTNPQIWCCRTNQTLPVAHKLFNLSTMVNNLLSPISVCFFSKIPPPPPKTNFQSLRPLRQYSTELPHMGPRSFSEMRDAALSFRKRMYRITLYLGAGFFFIVLPVSTLAAQAWEQRHWPMLQAKIISIVPVEGNKRVSICALSHSTSLSPPLERLLYIFFVSDVKPLFLQVRDI